MHLLKAMCVRRLSWELEVQASPTEDNVPLFNSLIVEPGARGMNYRQRSQHVIDVARDREEGIADRALDPSSQRRKFWWCACAYLALYRPEQRRPRDIPRDPSAERTLVTSSDDPG